MAPQPPPLQTSVSDAASDIPLEIVSEEEMALIDAAMTSVRCLQASSSHCLHVTPFVSLPPHVPSLLRCASAFRRTAPLMLSQKDSSQDIEDAGVSEIHLASPLQRYRSRRALSVTDIIATEWCEKQTEFILYCGKPERTKAMKAGSDRHAELEEEVVEKVQIAIKSKEDFWALKLLNFVIGANQLLFEGLTRELPILWLVEGVWMVGVIDEIRMPINQPDQKPLLVDTKTRYKSTLPSEAQKRNARLQMMCYKYMWDSIVVNIFPSNNFYQYFDLDPRSTLSKDVGEYSSTLGIDGKMLEDVVTYFRDTCCCLQSSQEKLMLRYEYQGDKSLLDEYIFDYDADWFKGQILKTLEFWSGEREANLVSEDERWKCNFCKYASICPASAISNSD